MPGSISANGVCTLSAPGNEVEDYPRSVQFEGETRSFIPPLVAATAGTLAVTGCIIRGGDQASRLRLQPRLRPFIGEFLKLISRLQIVGSIILFYSRDFVSRIYVQMREKVRLEIVLPCLHMFRDCDG